MWRVLRVRAGLAEGARVSVAAVADYMGDSPAVLLKTYTHLVPADNDRARPVVQAAFDDLQTQSAEDSLRTDEGQ